MYNLPLYNLTATEALAMAGQRCIDISEYQEACRSRIKSLDSVVGAWVEWNDSIVGCGSGGPLGGLPIGAKDIYQVAGYGTGWGAEYAPREISSYDSAIVAFLRKAGADCVGKTVTAEFAYFSPGPTRNPHGFSYTPGGSSSGSAAAVAAGMVPVALGTQTAASIIRPASYCGVIGFKPSSGMLPTAGLLHFSDSLDTPGYFARSVADIGLVHKQVLNGPTWAVDVEPVKPVSVGISQIPLDGDLECDMARAIEGTVDRLEAAGVRVEVAQFSDKFDALLEHHKTIIAYEGARSLCSYYRSFGQQMSTELQSLIEKGLSCSVSEYVHARMETRVLGFELEDDMKQFDFILGPSAPGAAPYGLSSTGDPMYSRAWTAVGLPAISLPVGTSVIDMPLGVQLIGHRFRDLELLEHADWVVRRLIDKDGVVPVAALGDRNGQAND